MNITNGKNAENHDCQVLTISDFCVEAGGGIP